MKFKIFFFVLIVSHLNSQSLGDQLRQSLESKKTMKEIMVTVDSFYAVIPNDIRDNGGDGLMKYKHWKRWEWEKGKELGPNGEFVNSTEMVLRADAEENRKNKGMNRSQLSGSWTSIGIKESLYSPDTMSNSYANGVGRVDRIAFHPSNPSIFYVGTPYGGLWKTLNGGTTWQCLTDTIPSIGISGIVVDWATPNIIYILTGTGDNCCGDFVTTFEFNNPSSGVMKSTDGGVTWNATGTLPTTPNIGSYIGYDIAQNPVYPLELLVATSDGVFLTLNGGTSWTKVKDGNHFDVEYKPNDADIVYCTDNDSIFYSTTYGTTWLNSSVNIAIPSTNNRIALGVTNAKTGNVYALCGKATGTGNFQGIYKSTDSGLSFTRIVNTPNILGYVDNGQDNKDQGIYDLAIAISPIDTNIVTTAAINVWGSTNGGVGFSTRSKWHENIVSSTQYVHPDHHSLTYNKLTNRLYTTHDGGINYSDDNGTTWTNITKGLIVSQFYHLAQFKNTPFVFGGGLQDNGIKFRGLGSKNAVHIYGADGFSAAFQPNNPNIMYSTINGGWAKFNTVTGKTIPSSNPITQFFKHVITHPTDTTIVYTGSNPIYRSTNGASSWTNVGSNGLWCIAISPSNPRQLYAAGGPQLGAGTGSISRSSNGGSNWTTLNTGSNGFPAITNIRVTDIAIHPTDSLTLCVTVGGFTAGSKIYYSTDGGTNFTNISSNLPNIIVYSVVLSSSKIYIGTSLGVYSKLNGSTNWTSIRDNMPKTPVTDIFVDENTGTITCSTFGRGLWERKYCVNQIVLIDSLKGKLAYESIDSIRASTFVPGNNDIDSIFLQSGKIKLFPGFQAKQGTYLKANIGNCDNGPQPIVGRNDGQDKIVEKKGNSN